VEYRFVLYAEGAGETGGRDRLLPPPGAELREEALGPAHFLIARCVEPRQVVFLAPLRKRGGRAATGSDFLRRRTLRQLLTTFDGSLRIDLMVVLVDHDGDKKRKATLDAHVEFHHFAPRIISVAVKEFESWLIGDDQLLRGMTAALPDLPRHPEKLRPGEAKNLLGKVLQDGGGSAAIAARRIEIARRCDLEIVSRICPSFQQLRADLKRILG